MSGTVPSVRISKSPKFPEILQFLSSTFLQYFQCDLDEYEKFSKIFKKSENTFLTVRSELLFKVNLNLIFSALFDFTLSKIFLIVFSKYFQFCIFKRNLLDDVNRFLSKKGMKFYENNFLGLILYKILLFKSKIDFEIFINTSVPVEYPCIFIRISSMNIRRLTC